MRKLLNIVPLLLLIGFLASCKKENKLIAEVDEVNTSSQAFVKINYASAYAANSSVQLKVNNTRVSYLLTARTPFPGGGYNTGGASQDDYLALTPGTVPFSISIPNKNTNNDSVVLFNSNITLAAGKHYSVHIADTAAKTKMIVLEDDISKADTGQSKYRFVNLIPNVTAIDLYYGTTLVAGNIPYLGNSNYFTMPRPATSLAWSIREAGTGPTGTVLATYTSASSTLSERSYTAFAMGYKGSTDAARKPYISFYLNY